MNSHPTRAWLAGPALAGALLLGGCDGQDTNAADTAAANAELMTNEAIVGENYQAGDDLGTADESPVAVAAIPTPASDLPAAEAAPVTEAAATAEAISRGTGIRRVRHGNGWAWMRGDEIVRTANEDGSEVAYFRGGSDRPYYVQRGDRGYAFTGDRPTRVFDRDGSARTPDAEDSRRAADLEQRARRDRETAQRPEQRADDRQRRDGRDDDRSSPGDRTGGRGNDDRASGDGGHVDHAAGDRTGAGRPNASPLPRATATSRPDRRGDRNERDQTRDRPSG